MDEIDPHERIRELEAEVDRYRAEEEQRRETGKKVVGAAAELTTRMHLGKEILPASAELFDAVNQNFRDRKLEIPTEESSELVAAVLRRLLRVRAWAIGFAIVGLMVATVPPYLQWESNRLLREQIQASHANNSSQTMLVQKQVQQQTNDTELVRRAQLIDIIYAEDCPELPLEGCVPRANLRARQEAALAFVEFEKNRGSVFPDLTHANLSGADLASARFGDTNLFAANLTRVNLTRADLRGANLSDANLTNASLNAAVLWLAYLNDANLTGANLTGANLDSSNFTGAKLRGANLGGADLTDADLKGADLADADLRGTNLTNANFDAVSLDAANLGDANLSGTSLDLAEGLTQAQIDRTGVGDELTELPEGIDVPSHWLKDTHLQPDQP